MDLVSMARDLGKEIQNSGEYKRLRAATVANDEDDELQELIKEFNLKRIQLSTAMQKENQDADEMNRLNTELKETYTKVMGNPNMMEYNVAKQDVDSIMRQITGILMLSANGEDPASCNPASCAGNCESCGGCH